MTVSRLGPIYDPLRNRGVPVLPFVYIGFVKKNDDAQRMGRLSVWIPELGGDPNEESSWVICSYCSPFAGATDITKIGGYMNNVKQVSQQSYGLWMVPPDLNNEVAVFFANGKVERAFWFGCAYQQYMNFMVPGVAVNVTTEPEPPVHVSPVIEYNKSDKSIDPKTPRRPPFHPLTDGLNTEGLVSDLERGSASTSARREAPSQVFGFLSPDANTVHIDDSSQNEFIRLRTKSGTQILVHETTGYVYINSKDGNAWLEVSDAGVDVYSANSVSIRAQQDFNIRADRHIILDAGGSISLRAGQKINMDAGNDVNMSAAHNLNISVAANGSLHIENDLKLKADANLRLDSGSDTSLKAGGRQLRDGSSIIDNGGQSPSASVTDSSVPEGKPVNDTTQTFSNGGSGSKVWKSGGGQVNTIVGRMPTHEPWFGHPNSKVPPPPLETVVPHDGGNLGGAGDNLNNDGCSFGASNTKPISTDSYNAITNASTQTGAPASYMFAIADRESSFNASAKNPNSSATGMFQMIDSTYSGMVNQYGNKYNVAPGSQGDANSNSLMGGQLIQNNISTLQKAGISNPTAGQVYMLHFMGDSGGTKFIQAAQNNPDAPAASMFPAAAAANKSIFYNSDGSSKSMGQVYNNITSSVDAKATAYADQYGLPAPCQRSSGGTPVAGKSSDPGAYGNDVGKVYGNGQCVALVKDVTGNPGTTATWGKGDSVQERVASGDPPPVGTGIATFGSQGTYTNSTDGTSHAAVITGYSKDANGNVTGVDVLDQWKGQPSHIRTLQFNRASGAIVDNGSNYSIINQRST